MKRNHGPRFNRAVLLQAFREPFERRGGDIGAILRRNNIPAEALTNSGDPIEASVLYDALEDMAAAIDDPYFCANVARAAAVRGPPVLVYAREHARTLGDFLVAAVLEIASQADNVVYSLNVTPDAAIFSIRRTRRIKKPLPQVDAIAVAFYVTLLQSGLGDTYDPERIIVSAPSFDAVPPDLLPPIALIRSRSVAFSLKFPPEWLLCTLELGWHRPGTQMPQISLSEPTRPKLGLLRELLGAKIGDEDFDLDELASTCGISRRQLQRMFSDQGTTFRKARDEVRREIAIDLVTKTRLPLQEVAQRIGFTGEAAFARSYRRWMNETPSAHRRRTRPNS